jgi:copper chaperone NosL
MSAHLGGGGLAALLGVFVFLAGCGEEQRPVQPQEITRTTACSLDGMILADYPGPKGQIHYDRGEPDFFCDTMELMSIHLQPEQKKRVVAVFTQDMAKTDWKSPQGHWIDAKTAWFVQGSRMRGSMGPTLATFARVEDAEAFARQHGGRVLRFEQITLEMVRLDGGVLKDERM